MVTIEFDARGHEAVTLELINSLGERIMGQKLEGLKPGRALHQMSLDGIAPGAYRLRYHTGTGDESVPLTIVR